MRVTPAWNIAGSPGAQWYSLSFALLLSLSLSWSKSAQTTSLWNTNFYFPSVPNRFGHSRSRTQRLPWSAKLQKTKLPSWPCFWLLVSRKRLKLRSAIGPGEKLHTSTPCCLPYDSLYSQQFSQLVPSAFSHQEFFGQNRQAIRIQVGEIPRTIRILFLPHAKRRASTSFFFQRSPTLLARVSNCSNSSIQPGDTILQNSFI